MCGKVCFFTLVVSVVQIQSPRQYIIIQNILFFILISIHTSGTSVSRVPGKILIAKILNFCVSLHCTLPCEPRSGDFMEPADLWECIGFSKTSEVFLVGKATF